MAVDRELENIVWLACFLRRGAMRGEVAEVRSLPTKSSLLEDKIESREPFMRGAVRDEVAEVSSLPAKSSLLEHKIKPPGSFHERCNR